MKKLAIITLAFIFSFGVESATAWSSFCHAGSVYVAEQHLTPKAKKMCRHYLKHTLPYYASWMDYWRSVPEYRSVNSQHTISAMPDGRTLDWSGKPKGKATPSTPVTITGFKELPNFGDRFTEAKDEKTARKMALLNAQEQAN